MEQDFPAGCTVVEIDKPGLFAIFFSKIENVLPSRTVVRFGIIQTFRYLNN